MTLQRSPRSEAGFALIEVVVSAAVLAIVALAVLSGLDAAGSSSAREKARSVAGALAEKDQERLRSFKFDALATVPQQPPVQVDGVTYTIQSEARWITDDVNATPACGSASQKQSEYLKVTTTVTSVTVGTKIPPVKVESLVAPSVAYAQDHGTLAVRVVDRKNVGVPGITVSATLQGGGALTPTATNDQGCALFRSVHVGTYTISLNTPGFLGPKGLQLTTSDATVVPNYVNLTSMAYDRAVTMTINVKTLRPGTPFTTTATRHDSKAWSVSDNAAETAVLRTFRASPVATFTSLTTPKLYPWDATAYSYFTGSCAYDSPVFHGSTNYFSALTATPPGINPEAAVKGDPTKVQPQPVTVFQPAINMRVQFRSNGLAPSSAELLNMNVYMTLQKPSGQTCTDAEYSVRRKMAIMDWPLTLWTPNPTTTGGANKNFVSQAATPATFDPGLPFGTYAVCLEDLNGTDKWYRTTYDNTDPDGQPSVLAIPPTNSTSSSTWNTSSSWC